MSSSPLSGGSRHANHGWYVIVLHDEAQWPLVHDAFLVSHAKAGQAARLWTRLRPCDGAREIYVRKDAKDRLGQIAEVLGASRCGPPRGDDLTCIDASPPSPPSIDAQHTGATTVAIARQPRIVIVDDEEDMRALCCVITRNAGMEPVAFAEPVDVIHYLTQDVHVDALLTDLHLSGMSGLELAQRVAESKPHVPVVVMTGRHDFVDAAIAAGAIPLLKPFFHDQLVAALRDALDGGTRRRV